MLHVEVSRYWSKGLIGVYTDAKAQFDVTTNSLTKFGAALKQGDIILRKVDPNGYKSKTFHTWRIQKLIYYESLRPESLVYGEDYGIYIQSEQAVLPYKLVAKDFDTHVSQYNRC